MGRGTGTGTGVPLPAVLVDATTIDEVRWLPVSVLFEHGNPAFNKLYILTKCKVQNPKGLTFVFRDLRRV